MSALQALDRQPLRLVKEKLPARSKAAMVSAVSGRQRTTRPAVEAKAIRRLDAHILSLIFTLAATPEQRMVRITSFEEDDDKGSFDWYHMN